MLMCRSYVSWLNKFVIVYMIALLIVIQVYRWGEDGSICSGEDLTEEELDDPAIADKYMIQIGTIFRGYILGLYSLLLLSVLVGLLVAYLLHKAFS